MPYLSDAAIDAMLAFLLALLLPALSGLPTDEEAPCARRDALREEVVAASRAPQRDEALQALAFRSRSERADPAQAACKPDLLRTEALALLFLGEYVESLAAMDRLVADYPDLDADFLGRTHTNRGYLLTRLGRTADAALAYAAAAERAAEVEPKMGARFLLEASKTYRLLRRPVAAATYLEAAATLAQSVGSNDLDARILTERALQTWRASAKADHADPALTQQSLGEARAALALYDDHPGTRYQSFTLYLLIADAYLSTDQVEEADLAVREAGALLHFMDETYTPVGRVRLDLYIGHVASSMGDEAAAERAYERATRSARRLGEAALEMEALRQHGDLIFDVAPGRAVQLYRQAIDAAEVSRESLGLQDWSVSAFERYQEPYLRLVRALALQGEYEEAFVQLDALRARYLRDLRASAALRRTLGPEQQEALATQHERLSSARSRLADPVLAQAERTRHELTAARAQAEIEAITGARPAPPRPLRLDALQSALQRRQQHLVTYFLDEKVAVAFVVRADTFAVRTLPAGAAAIREAAHALDVLSGGADDRHRAPSLDALHRLYALTIAPIADLLPDGEPVVIIPDASLVATPFALLVEEPSGRFNYADAPFLLRRHPLSTELAASLIVESGGASTRSGKDEPFIAFGRSQFEGAPQSLRAGEPLGALPFVPNELERIVAEMGQGHAYLDEAATERAFDEALAAPRLLHLATHVLPDAELPLYSHAVLWDDPDAEDDGILYAYEIEDRLLDLDLVVLSGCETGRGRGERGEGMQSLQYAFRAAGARSTVATLWQVDDRATAFVMDRFYHHLGLGARKDVALQQAQLDYLDAHDGALASPTLWAAAVLYGDPSPLAWTDDRGGALGWILLGLGAIALAALPIAYRRRRRARLR